MISALLSREAGDAVRDATTTVLRVKPYDYFSPAALLSDGCRAGSLGCRDPSILLSVPMCIRC